MVAQERRYLLTIGDTIIFIFMSWACPRFTSTKNFVKFLLQNLVVQRLPPRRPSGPFLLISIYSKFGTLPGLRKSCGCKASPRKEGREKRRQGSVKRTGKKINDIKWLAIDIKHLMHVTKDSYSGSHPTHVNGVSISICIAAGGCSPKKFTCQRIKF
jgi:hypothetical protein